MEINTVEILHEVDKALAADDNERRSRTTVTQAETKKGERIGALLRMTGSIVLIAAAITFLMQRWGTMDDILRYLSFLAFTGLLTVSGFMCGVKIKEDKGARTFLALAAAMVTVNFAQLGALLFSAVGSLKGANIPHYLLWTAPSLSVAVMTAAGAGVVLVAVTAIAMRVLSGGQAPLLTVGYLATNALLLVPSREPWIVGSLFGAALIAAVEVNRRVSQDSSSKTVEGRIARGLLFVPALIEIGRNLVLYQATPSLIGLALLTVAGAMHIGTRTFADKYRRSFEIASYPIGALGWLLVAAVLHSELQLWNSLLLPLIALPIATVLSLLSVRVKDSGELERTLAGIVITMSALFEVFAFSGITSSIYALVIGLTAMVIGYTSEKASYLYSGALCFGIGILVHIDAAIRLASMSPWVSLAVLGIGIVIASSMFEKNYTEIARRFREFRTDLREWN